MSRQYSCNFCGAPAAQIVHSKCNKCGTSYPRDAQRTSINSKAGFGKRRRPQDADANGGWANVAKAAEE